MRWDSQVECEFLHIKLPVGVTCFIVLYTGHTGLQYMYIQYESKKKNQVEAIVVIKGKKKLYITLFKFAL